MIETKGIILAGGSGTRLHPTTIAVNKHLLPVYDKPMIHYPLSTLKKAGVKEVLIITTPDDVDSFKKLLGDGVLFDMYITYAVQETPTGIAEAFIIGKEFIGTSSVCLMLGDNVLHGNDVYENLLTSEVFTVGQYGDDDVSHRRAKIFAYPVNDPQRYGVLKMKENPRPYACKVESIIEKPETPPSKWAVVGLYCYPCDVVEKVTQLTPSARGELEITDLNNLYLSEDRCDVTYLKADSNLWLDTGTHDSLLEASQLIKALQERVNTKVGEL